LGGPNDTHVNSYPRREAKTRTIRFASGTEMLDFFKLAKDGRYYHRLAEGFKRVFAATIFFGTEHRPDSSCVIDCPRVPGELPKLS